MKEIFEYYKNIKGCNLDWWESYNISKFFIPVICPIHKWEKDFNTENINKYLEILKIFPEKMPKLQHFQIKPVNQKTLKDLHYQALIDYKNNNCSIEVVNYIEKQLQ